MSARELDIGYAPVLALRVTYLGELGYELHVPVEYALHLYERCGRPASGTGSPTSAIARSTAFGSKSTT